MTKTRLLVALAVTVAGLSSSAASAIEKRTVIHFADLSGVWDWRASGDDALLIEGATGKSFKATFWGSCPEVRYSDSIGFVTDVTGELDRFSSIIAHGHRCSFRTFQPTEFPPKRTSE